MNVRAVRETVMLLFICLSPAFTAGPGDREDAGFDEASRLQETAGSLVPEEYRISPFDVLEISVYQEPDLLKTVRVSQDGYISFPLVGKIQVVGLDVLKLEEKLEELLGRDYLVNPNVTVFVKEYDTRKVFVLGEVKNPGAYAIAENKGLTVLEAIVLAGGFSNAASVNKTRVIRIEGGIKKAIEVRIEEITKKGDKSKDIPLQPGDIVLVPERIF